MDSNGIYSVDTALGSVLVPYLESALERSDLRTILEVCAFLEDASEASRTDNSLEEPIAIGIGEWLGHMKHEDRLSPWLGKETRRITSYTEGLATQRRQIRAEEPARSFKTRLKTFLKRALNRQPAKK